VVPVHAGHRSCRILPTEVELSEEEGHEPRVVPLEVADVERCVQRPVITVNEIDIADRPVTQVPNRFQRSKSQIVWAIIFGLRSIGINRKSSKIDKY